MRFKERERESGGGWDTMREVLREMKLYRERERGRKRERNLEREKRKKER